MRKSQARSVLKWTLVYIALWQSGNLPGCGTSERRTSRGNGESHASQGCSHTSRNHIHRSGSSASLSTASRYTWTLRSYKINSYSDKDGARHY
jgi:hypothetical protein